MENIIMKTSEQFGTVRCIEENGKVLFCAADVAKALGYTRPNDAISAHCRATVKRRTPISGKIQEINYIPEGDVYRLITHSKLPAAGKFEKWVFEDVVPKAVRDNSRQITEQLTLETSEYHYFDKTFHGVPVLSMADIAHFTGLKEYDVYKSIKTQCRIYTEYYHLRKRELAEYKTENPNVSKTIRELIVVTKDGFIHLMKILKCRATMPKCFQESAKPLALQSSQKPKPVYAVVRDNKQIQQYIGEIKRLSSAVETLLDRANLYNIEIGEYENLVRSASKLSQDYRSYVLRLYSTEVRTTTEMKD